MKGFVVCFAIVCLAIASGAPTEEESKVVSKRFNFDKKEVIYSRKPFSKDELVYAVCEGSSEHKKCKVYVESANEDAVQSCDLNLTYFDKFNIQVALFNTGNSKAVFAIRDGETKIKLISVNLKGCQIKEASVDVPFHLSKEAPTPLQVVIVGREKEYDVVYHNKDLCHDFLCKATFDYEGKVVKAPSGFLVQDLEFTDHQIEPVKNAYLVSESNFISNNVYLVHDEDTKPHTLLSVPRSVVAVSVEENKLGLCRYSDQKLVCSQYDSEGKTKIYKVEVKAEHRLDVIFLDVLNLEKGLLTVSIENDIDSNKRKIFVAHFDEQGWMGKFVEVDLKCDRPKIVLPTLYKSSNGEYCVSSLCTAPETAPFEEPQNYSVFFRNTRCFHKAELF